MLHLQPAPLFTFVVQFPLPGSDERKPLQLTARHKSRKQLQQWITSAQGRKDADFLAEVITDWGNVLGADDTPVPYSPEALAVLLDAYPAASDVIFEAYMAQLTEAREKNSPRRR